MTENKEANVMNPIETDLSSCLKHETYDNRDVDRSSSQTDHASQLKQMQN